LDFAAVAAHCLIGLSRPTMAPVKPDMGRTYAPHLRRLPPRLIRWAEAICPGNHRGRTPLDKRSSLSLPPNSELLLVLPPIAGIRRGHLRADVISPGPQHPKQLHKPAPVNRSRLHAICPFLMVRFKASFSSVSYSATLRRAGLLLLCPAGSGGCRYQVSGWSLDR